MDVNKHIIQGRLASDPEVFRSDRGCLVRFAVYTARRWKDAEGQWQSRDTRHVVVVRGALAEMVADQLSKGGNIRVEGYAYDHEYSVQGDKRVERQLVAQEVSVPLIPPRVRAEEENRPTGEQRRETPDSPDSARATETPPREPRSSTRHESAAPAARRPAPPQAPPVASHGHVDDHEDDPFGYMDRLVERTRV